MNKTMKLILGIFLFLTQTALGQTFNYPKCNSQSEPDLKIVKVTRGDYSTTIDFEYVRSEAQGIYILLNSPNTDGAYYIKADGKVYKLTSTSGIGNANGVTPARKNIPVRFSATFEKIPENTTQFDLIEGSNGSWNFYGVQLLNLSEQQISKTDAKMYFSQEDWEKYFAENGCENKIEGIWNESSNLRMIKDGISEAYPEIFTTIAICKKGDYFYRYNVGQPDGDTIDFQSTSSSDIYIVKNYEKNKYGNNCSTQSYMSFENNLFFKFSIERCQFWYIGDNVSVNEDYKCVKIFPKSENESGSSKASGTGFAISTNGYIVTNHHVTDGATSILVRGVNEDFSVAYNAKIVVEDKNNDLSIIKIEDTKFTTIAAIPYVIEKRSLDVGSPVYVLGYPLRATMGDEVKLTNGIISSKSGFQGDVTSYQITAPVQPGNSGGPLFDEKGNIIGIINAKHVGAENASYAIKSSYLMNLIDLLPTPPKLQTISTVAGKPLTEQVKILKKFTYIIEIN